MRGVTLTDDFANGRGLPGAVLRGNQFRSDADRAYRFGTDRRPDHRQESAGTLPRLSRRTDSWVHIYRPARSVMQSGTAKRPWVLEFEPSSRPFLDPLTGWTGSKDPKQQVRLEFPTKDTAIAFAERQGWCYQISEPKLPKIEPKRYEDNFTLERLYAAAMRRGGPADRSDNNSQSMNPVDEAALEWFPASDPPCWIGAALG